MYLLDTNVISETIKKTPDSNVIKWLHSIPSSKFALSVLTLGEIRKGVEKLVDQQKKQKILQWLEIELLAQFESKIITIDSQVADKLGHITAL